jgi:hypothetical protein
LNLISIKIKLIVKIKINRIIVELHHLYDLFYNQKYYLIILFPLLFLIRRFFSQKKDEKIYLYINNNNYREVHIAEILSEKKQIQLIYKEIPAYLPEIIKIDCGYLKPKNFFLNYLFNRSKKIVFFGDTTQVLPFLIFDRNIIISAYDTVIGRGMSKTFEIAELIVMKISKYILERDLRLHKNYKKFYKLNKIKNVYVSDKFNIKDSKKLNEIHAVSLGWIDNNICKIEKTIEFLCSQEIYVHIFSSHKNLFLLCPYIKNQKNKFGKFLIIEEPIFGEKLLNKISEYHLGISPHEQHINYGNVYLNKYYEHCASTRIADFLSCKIINIISKKYRFNDYIIKKYGGAIIYYEELFHYKNNLREIIQKISNNDQYVKNYNHFDNKYKAKKLHKFFENYV